MDIGNRFFNNLIDILDSGKISDFYSEVGSFGIEGHVVQGRHTCVYLREPVVQGAQFELYLSSIGLKFPGGVRVVNGIDRTYIFQGEIVEFLFLGQKSAVRNIA